MRTRILIADDHAMIRDGLNALINRQADMEVVGKAENGRQAIELARELQPDVILMDVKMPVMDGIEATYQILSEMPGIKILALSMSTDNGFIKGMMHAGARGYIAKDSEPEVLYRAIRKAAGPGNSRSPQND